MKKYLVIFGLFFGIFGLGSASCMQDALPPYTFDLSCGYYRLDYQKAKLRDYIIWHIYVAQDCIKHATGLMEAATDSDEKDVFMELETTCKTCINDLQEIQSEIQKQMYCADFYKLYERYVDAIEPILYVKKVLAIFFIKEK